MGVDAILETMESLGAVADMAMAVAAGRDLATPTATATAESTRRDPAKDADVDALFEDATSASLTPAQAVNALFPGDSEQPAPFVPLDGDDEDTSAAVAAAGVGTAEEPDDHDSLLGDDFSPPPASGFEPATEIRNRHQHRGNRKGQPPARISHAYKTHGKGRGNDAIEEDRRQERLKEPFYKKYNNLPWRIVQTFAWLMFPLSLTRVTEKDPVPPYGRWIKRNRLCLAMTYTMMSNMALMYTLWNTGMLINPMNPITTATVVDLPIDQAALASAKIPVAESYTPTPITFSQADASYTQWLRDMRNANTSFEAKMPAAVARVYELPDHKNISYDKLYLTLRSAQISACRERLPDVCTCMSAPEMGIFINAIYFDGKLLLNAQVEEKSSVQPINVAFEGGKQTLKLPMGARINATLASGDAYEKVLMKEDAWCVLRALHLLGVDVI